MTTTAVQPITDDELVWARNARAAHPQMTPYGFMPGPDNQWGDDLLPEHLAEIAIARRWLQARPWRATANSQCIGSYSAKHLVESWARRQGFSRTYVREGALLLAAVELGVPVKPYSDGRWGGYLGVSKRGLYD